ncbi:MAG: TolC family protein [Salinivirgaceae bacterium]|nr:TolC family protein [Salinivirgaceae bacterium]
MKHLKSFILLSVLSISLQGTMYAQNDTLHLSLIECIELLQKSNSNVAIARQNAAQKSAEQQATRGLYYPQIGVNATFGILSKPVAIDLNPIGDALTGLYTLSAGQTQLLGALNPAITQTAEYAQLLGGAAQGLDAVQNGEWTKTLLNDQVGKIDAKLMWPIYTGGKIRAANKAGEVLKNEAESKLASVQNAEISMLVNRYFGLQLMMGVVEVRKSVVDAMKHHFENAEKLTANGLASDVERIHAKVAFVESERELRKVYNDVEMFEIAIKNILNTDSVILPIDDLKMHANINSMDSYVARAKENNPVFDQIGYKKVLANQAIIKERSQYLPDVALMGSYDLYRYEMSDLMPDWYVGLGVRLNIFEGFSKTHKVQAAKIQREQINTFQEKIENDIEAGITQAYLAVIQSVDRYKTSEESLTLAEEYLRVREKAFAQGFATSVDVVDANLNLSSVKIERLKTLYEFNVAKAKLMELTGDVLLLAQDDN